MQIIPKRQTACRNSQNIKELSNKLRLETNFKTKWKGAINPAMAHASWPPDMPTQMVLALTPGIIAISYNSGVSWLMLTYDPES